MDKSLVERVLAKSVVGAQAFTKLATSPQWTMLSGVYIDVAITLAQKFRDSKDWR
jgi:hypothetical protein